MKVRIGILLTIITMLAGLYVWVCGKEALYARAEDLGITKTTQTVHLLDHEYNIVKGRVWDLEWEEKQRELTRKELETLKEGELRMQEIQTMKGKYLDKVVK
jgi:hypothetical protein